MRPILWGDGTSWGDPNARWGSPSHVLEPGDPGYVNTGLPPGYSAPVSTQKKTKTMNETPDNTKVLRAVAHDMADGLHNLQDIVGMKQNREADVRADLMKLEGDPSAPAASNANKGSELVYNTCKAATAAAYEALDTVESGTVKKFLGAYRKMLVDVLGAEWSAAWTPAGFAGPGNALPENTAGKLSLLSTARAFLTANPALEIDLPAPHTKVTAAEALARHTELSNARELINTSKGEQETCKNVRDADVKTLRKRVSGTISELGQVLGPADGRWEDFGLNIPAHPSVPLPVASVTLSPAGSGRALAEWPHARRGVNYRVLIKVTGVDADFREADKTKDLELVLKDLPSGVLVEVKIVASNAAGDATPSPVASITLL